MLYLEVSLICVGIHVCFRDGMVFERLRIDNYLIDYPKFDWITKPMYDCLPCMASLWSIILLQTIDIKAMFVICGLNALFASVLQFFDSAKLPE